MNWAWLSGGLMLAVVCACDSKQQPQPPVQSATPSSAPAASPAAVAANSAKSAPASSALAKASADAFRMSSLTPTATGPWLGQLADGSDVGVLLATQKDPLAPRAPVAFAAVAELVGGELVPKTEFRSVALKTLAKATPESSRSKLGQLRVLANGRVELALVQKPKGNFKAFDLAQDVAEQPPQVWEQSLMSKTEPPSELRPMLARYQKLLAVDVLVENLRRGPVLVDGEAKRLVALEYNDVFSPAGREGAVRDALTRLSRHLTFSKSLEKQLSALSRPALEEALRPAGGSLLITPRQVEQILGHRDALVKLIQRRVKQRGAERALSLP